MKVILAWLAWLLADPQAVNLEHPLSAAAVAVAAASMVDGGTPPQPQPPSECCKDCQGTGQIKHPDGHRTPCPCPAGCSCKR